VNNEEWVEQKLDHGMMPEDVKRILKDNGKDPEIVDRIMNGESPNKANRSYKTYMFGSMLIMLFAFTGLFLMNGANIDQQSLGIGQNCEESFDFDAYLANTEHTSYVEMHLNNGGNHTDLYSFDLEYEDGNRETFEVTANPTRNRLLFEGSVVNGTVSPTGCPEVSEFLQ